MNLVPLAESVVKLNAVCMHCYQDAAFTKRLGSEKMVGTINLCKNLCVYIRTPWWFKNLQAEICPFNNQKYKNLLTCGLQLNSDLFIKRKEFYAEISILCSQKILYLLTLLIIYFFINSCL